MAQHDGVIDNADGMSVRLDINAVVQALMTCNSGTTPPQVTYPGQLWLDLSVPTDGVMRQRSQDNQSWLPILLPPDFRFPQADLFFGARTDPNRFVWNNAFDGSGADIATLSESGILSVGGPPVLPGDVPTKSYVDAVGMPPGAIIFVAMATPPIGYLKCNGASLARDLYANLFAAIGTTYGAADSSTFKVPDMRGEFIRCLDDGANIDSGRVIGSKQASDFASHDHAATSGTESVGHTHTFSDTSSSTSSAGSHAHAPSGGNFMVYIGGSGGQGTSGGGFGQSGTTAAAGAHTHTVAVSGTTGGRSAAHTHVIDVQPRGGADTRPRNIAQLACIKY